MNLQKIKPCRPRPIYMNKNGGNMCFTLMSNVHVKNLEKQPHIKQVQTCLLYTSPSPRDRTRTRMPSSA